MQWKNESCMKQFNLFHAKQNQSGLYEIWFGNRTCVIFKQKRQAKAFLAETNRFLTLTMVELNEVLKQIYSEYRNTWFVMQNFKNGKPINYTHEESKIKSALHNAEEMFERAGNTFYGSADNAWSFIYMKKICWFLNDAIALLTDIHRKRNNTMNYHILDVLKKRLITIIDTIEKYPGCVPKDAVEVKSNN